MNRLSIEQRVRVLSAPTEGASVRVTVRMTGAAKGTVLKLLAEIGAACEAFQRETLVDLKTTRLEIDEIWSFIGAKARNAKKVGDGDIWTFTALDADTKLMVSTYVGQRTTPEACDFPEDVKGRLSNRV